MDNLKFLIFHGLIYTIQALCNYPAELQNKEWTDNTKGKIVYTNSTMTGWSFHVYSHTITDWECHFRNDEFVASRSTVNFGIYGAYYRAYICQKFQMSTNTVYYYLMSDRIDTGERVHVTGSIPSSICEVCSPSSSAPDDGEYYAMTSTSTSIENSTNPTVGCNSCTHQCDQPGTPALTTSSINDNDLTFETGPPFYVQRYKDDDDDEVETKDSSPVKLIVGVVCGVLVITLITGVAFWMTRRGLCVRNVLDSFYEEKKLNPIS